ncbi:MAG: DUF3298 domain-containing protein [Candidatus Cryptobacteroides sp.]
MKNLKSASAALVAAVILSGCGQETFYKTQRIFDESMTELAEGAKDSLRLKIDVEIPLNAPEGVAEVVTDALFGNPCGAAKAVDAAAAYKDGAVKAYREINLPLWEKFDDKDETPMGLSWEEIVEGYFAGSRKNIVSYLIIRYSFTGGAHGSSLEGVLNFDRESGKEITEEDIFVPGYEETLSRLLTEKVTDVIGENGVLFVDTIEPNGNFLVSEKTITYIYNQYEIAPYSTGIIRIPVEWESLSEVLKQ